MPLSTGFRCTPTPRCPRIGVISWSACCGTRRRGAWRWSVLRKMPMGTSYTHAPSRGLTAPPASHSRHWHSWRSWQRSSPCRASIWCAMRDVWRHRASFGTRLFRHRANRGWTRRRRRRVPLPGTGQCSWGACLRWIWPPVPCADCCLLSIITSITQESVITRLLRHCKPAAVPPPLAPARARQATFDWVA